MTNAGSAGLSFFTTTSMKPSRTALNLGAGVVSQVGDGLEITGRVDLEHRKGFNNTTASVNLRWNW